ncbi:MAG: hypothetical protein LH631_05710 [Alkalinema sp. CAN_BIN05]|nr:hypothetical protein [Alkalinema sp. CAN_BIN05]
MPLPKLCILYTTVISIFSLSSTAQAQVILPKPGDYYGRGSMLSRSTRTVQQKGDRICLSTVNGPATPYEGFLEINVSSLFTRGNQIHRDGDGQVISVATDGKSIGSGLMRFQLNSDLPNRKLSTREAFLMNACMKSTSPYSQEIKGTFIKGLKFPSGS